MKLKIWKEGITGDSEDQLYIKLRESMNKDGDILLTACNKNGEEIKDGKILQIDNHFSVVVMLEGVNSQIPLKTDIRDSVMAYDRRDIQAIIKEKTMELLADQMKKSMEKEEEDERTNH